MAVRYKHILIVLTTFFLPGTAQALSQNNASGGPCYENLHECIRGCGSNPSCIRFCEETMHCDGAASAARRSGGGTQPTKPLSPTAPSPKAPATGGAK
jgi:hypothetical protein